MNFEYLKLNNSSRRSLPVLVFIYPALARELLAVSTQPRNVLELKPLFRSLTWQFSLPLPQICLLVHLVFCHFSVKCDLISSANHISLGGNVSSYVSISQLTD